MKLFNDSPWQLEKVLPEKIKAQVSEIMWEEHSCGMPELIDDLSRVAQQSEGYQSDLSIKQKMYADLYDYKKWTTPKNYSRDHMFFIVFLNHTNQGIETKKPIPVRGGHR